MQQTFLAYVCMFVLNILQQFHELHALVAIFCRQLSTLKVLLILATIPFTRTELWPPVSYVHRLVYYVQCNLIKHKVHNRYHGIIVFNHVLFYEF